MPFSPPLPRSFSNTSIREYAPALSGVYGISNGSCWIYVGEADNIQEALLLHLGDTNSAVSGRQPTGFSFEACDRARRVERQNRLVLELEPVCNRLSAASRRPVSNVQVTTTTTHPGQRPERKETLFG